MKCPDCKQREADVEIVVAGKARIVCGLCKRAAYVVYSEGNADVTPAPAPAAEGVLPEVPQADED